MITLTNRIDMRPGAVPLVIHLGQYDSDFSLVFELYSSAGNFTVESGTTAMIRGTKTDGNAYDADATIDVSAKTVTVAGSEQMTAAKGRNVYELVLTKSGKVLSTANFILDVERAAMDADTIASESVLKELNAIIDSAATSTQAAADAASAADRAEDAAESVSSASAQIATNTEDISDLKADFEQLEPGLSDDAKAAILACFQHVAWVDEHGQDYYDALESALYEDQYPKITAVFNPGANVIYTDDTLDSLKQYLTVKYFETEESAGTVIASANYSLSGTLTEGTSTVFVSYSGLTTSFIVNGVVDFYNIWTLTYPSMLLDRYLGNITATSDGNICTNTNVHNRANISTNKGRKEIYDTYTSMYLQNRYPIPIPAEATSVTVVYDSDVWISGSEWVLRENQYTRLQDLGSLGYGGGTPKSLSTGANRFLTLVCGMSGNPDLSENNKPTSVTITFT